MKIIEYWRRLRTRIAAVMLDAVYEVRIHKGGNSRNTEGVLALRTNEFDRALRTMAKLSPPKGGKIVLRIVAEAAIISNPNKPTVEDALHE